MTTATTSSVTTASVTSRDGTSIGYRQLGQGPGLVVLHGAMSSGYHHLDLAEALANAFTVYLPDRRGRGLSGPYGTEYSVQQDVEDLDALLTKTGAQHLFGVSSGAIIALQAALTLPAIHKVAIYEPPLFVDRPVPSRWLERFDREMAEGRVAAALITGMKAAQMGPPFLNAIPRWLLERMTRMMLSREDRNGAGEYVPMSALAPTLHYDGLLIAEMSDRLETFRGITADTLLLGGSKSPAYMKATLAALERILPNARRVELPGLDHGASWNKDRRGRPAPVAAALLPFFA